MKLTIFEKQLIALSSLGIWIEHCDGHRWINSQETEYFNFHEELEKHGIALNNKIYGGIKEVIVVVDKCFELMGRKSLLDVFDGLFEEEKHAYFIFSDFESRIDIVNKGEGGLF
jgi:hypothetical protein